MDLNLPFSTLSEETRNVLNALTPESKAHTQTHVIQCPDLVTSGNHLGLFFPTKKRKTWFSDQQILSVARRHGTVGAGGPSTVLGGWRAHMWGQGSSETPHSSAQEGGLRNAHTSDSKDEPCWLLAFLILIINFWFLK